MTSHQSSISTVVSEVDYFIARYSRLLRCDHCNTTTQSISSGDYNLPNKHTWIALSSIQGNVSDNAFESMKLSDLHSKVNVGKSDAFVSLISSFTNMTLNRLTNVDSPSFSLSIEFDSRCDQIIQRLTLDHVHSMPQFVNVTNTMVTDNDANAPPSNDAPAPILANIRITCNGDGSNTYTADMKIVQIREPTAYHLTFDDMFTSITGVILLPVRSGPRTQIIGIIDQAVNSDHSTPTRVPMHKVIGTINWFDARVRTLRPSRHRCYDCMLFTSICIPPQYKQRFRELLMALDRSNELIVQ
jgi:hypothetical protein